MQLFAHGLQLPVAPLRAPLDVTLEGSYSPQDIFFRTFRLANERVSLGGFLMLGSNFLELQALELSLDGVPRAEGTLFLPWSVAGWRHTGRLLEALDERQKFDVDSRSSSSISAAITWALGENSDVAGTLSGHVAGLWAAAEVAADNELAPAKSRAIEGAKRARPRTTQRRGQCRGNGSRGVCRFVAGGGFVDAAVAPNEGTVAPW